MKIHPFGAELFQADGRADMKKLIVAFRNWANAPKIDHRIAEIGSVYDFMQKVW
jgi:hypothetical protein